MDEPEGRARMEQPDGPKGNPQRQSLRGHLGRASPQRQNLQAEPSGTSWKGHPLEAEPSWTPRQAQTIEAEPAIYAFFKERLPKKNLWTWKRRKTQEDIRGKRAFHMEKA